MLSRVVVPSVCFTPWSGVRIPLTTAPASLPCTPLFVAMRHLPPTGGSLCSLAAVSSAAIPVRVKLKTPRANAAAATTLDIPSRWDPRANQSPTGALVAVLRTAALSRVVVPSVCFTPWGGVRILLTTAPASLPCTPLFVTMRHLPPTGGSLCSLAAVSSAAIPVRVKLKTPLRIAAAATTVDIPSRWDPRANQSPTGALVAVLRTAALFDSRAGQIKNALAHCAKAFL